MSVVRRLSKWMGSDCLIILTKLDRYLLMYIRISGWCFSNFYGTLTFTFIQAKYVKSSSAIHILNYIKSHEVKP